MNRSNPTTRRHWIAAAACVVLLAGCGGGATDATTTGTATGNGGASSAATLGAAFAASASQAVLGETVLFSDQSTGSPTAWAWDFGDGGTSAQADTGHVYAAAGTYTVKLTVTGASGSASTTRQVVVTATGTGQPAFTMAQTLSDGAQRTTLAFDGLGLMAGNLAAQSFFPPGKVADYTGFQYLRDNDPDNMGHNTSFLTRIANAVLNMLDDAQLAQLKALAAAELSLVQQYGYGRFTLMQAFRQLIDGTGPAAQLRLAGVKAASKSLYVIDGQISFGRAQLYATIYRGLTASQTAVLDGMKGKGWASWPDIPDSQVRSKLSGLPQGTATLVMTYASDLFSWYAGTIDADVYFCPERHGTYYGGFYMKDAPAVGHEGYSISEQLTATAGSALSDASRGYVTAAQAAQFSTLVETQRANLYAGADSIVQVRTDIALLLRSLRKTGVDADAVKAKVLALSGTYGELDGENNYHYATVFAQVWASMSAAQKARVTALRSSILSGSYADGTTFDFTTASTPYLFADPVTDTSVLAPYLAAASGLF